MQELEKKREKKNQKGKNLGKVFEFWQRGMNTGEEEYMENRSIRSENEGNRKNNSQHFLKDNRCHERYRAVYSERDQHRRPGHTGSWHQKQRRFVKSPHSKNDQMGHRRSPYLKIHGPHGCESRGHRSCRDIIREIGNLERQSRRIHRRLHILRHELAAR